MKKVHQLLGLNKPIDGLFGIEIETEGRNLCVMDSKFWKTEADNSLRGQFPEKAAEYVLKKPIAFKDVDAALDEIINSQRANNAVFDFSFRTSVHVHVNVQDMTEDQVLAFIYTYLLLEEPLMTFCGRERKGNRFCLRAVDADNLIEILNVGFGNCSVNDLVHQDGNQVRYASINIAALAKYGSIEFRGMRGNMDKEILHNWVAILSNIRDYAVEAENPEAVLKHFEKVSPDRFLSDVVSPPFFDILKYPRMVREIQRSFSLALDLPYSYINAKARGEALQKEKQAEMVRARARKVVPPEAIPVPDGVDNDF